MTTQQERLEYLIRYLEQENPAGVSQVERHCGKDPRQRLRGMLNIRPPHPIDPAFIAVENAFLQAELDDKDITPADAVPSCSLHPSTGLWLGDITTLAADAIVNAANSQLLGCFGPCHDCIDNAIHTAAGVQLRLECHEIMQRQQHDEATGQAKITKGYNLPSKHVIHTVGPIVSSEVTSQHRDMLAACYRSCLNCAHENNLRSLAFCCISTGVFNFPPDQAARIAVETVGEFLTGSSSLKKIIFCVFSQSAYDLYHDILNRP